MAVSLSDLTLRKICLDFKRLGPIYSKPLTFIGTRHQSKVGTLVEMMFSVLLKPVSPNVKFGRLTLSYSGYGCSPVESRYFYRLITE